MSDEWFGLDFTSVPAAFVSVHPVNYTGAASACSHREAHLEEALATMAGPAMEAGDVGLSRWVFASSAFSMCRCSSLRFSIISLHASLISS